MIGRKENLKEKKYLEDGAENANVDLKDSPTLKKYGSGKYAWNSSQSANLTVIRHILSHRLNFAERFGPNPAYVNLYGTLWKFDELVEQNNGRDREHRIFARVFRTVYVLNLFIRNSNLNIENSFYTVQRTLAFEYLKFRSIAVFIFWVGLILGFFQLLYYFR